MSSIEILNDTEKMNPAKYKAFFGAYIGWVFDYYEVFIMSFIVIPMAVTLSLTTEQVAQVFSIQLGFLALGGEYGADQALVSEAVPAK